MLGFVNAISSGKSRAAFGVRRHVAALKAQTCLRTPNFGHSLSVKRLSRRSHCEAGLSVERYAR
jgi:hypothetical protein